MTATPKKDEKNITVWGDPGEKVVAHVDRKVGGKTKRVKLMSGYGNVTYRNWCDLELERMKSTTDNVHVIERESDGFIALARVR